MWRGLAVRPVLMGTAFGIGLFPFLGGAAGADEQPDRSAAAIAAASASARGGHVAPADTLPSAEELAAAFTPDGDPDEGREWIRRHAAAASTDEATLWIQLLAVVERVEPEILSEAVLATAEAVAGASERGAERLLDRAGEVAPEDRPALLQLAALLLDEADPERAAEVRGRLVETHADADEAPEAMLVEARRLLGIDGGGEEGRSLLETLIVGAPDHPIAPPARRLLDGERMPAMPEENPE